VPRIANVLWIIGRLILQVTVCSAPQPCSHDARSNAKRVLPDGDRVEELGVGHPAVALDRVVLHQRDDHEAAAVRERAHLERDPDEGEQAARPSRYRGHQRPEMHTRTTAALGELPGDLDHATHEQHEHEPRTDRRRRHSTERCIRDPPPVRARAPPALRHEPDAGAHSNGRHRRACARARAAHPVLRRAAQEHHCQREDRRESGKDERRATGDGAERSRDPPCTEDRQLGGRGTGEQIARGEGVLEVVRGQPSAPVDAQVTQ
jgi:hypothetical protein